MKESVWKKYEEIEGLPKEVSVEICETAGDEVKFDKNYSEYYLLDGQTENLISPDGLKKSFSGVEEKVYEVQKRSDWTANDIFRILAWKTGKINHEKSKDKQEIQYYANWIEGRKENNIVSLQMPYQQVLHWKEFKPLAEKIGKMRKKWCREEIDAFVIWNELLKLVEDNKNNLRGLGTVYLITLLHFITGGEYPIYDRFAMASLVVWKLKSCKNEINIAKNSVIRGCLLPEKDAKAAKDILSVGIYCEYINLLKQFCKAHYGNEDEWKDNRNVDRALWVYGHFFKVNE